MLSSWRREGTVRTDVRPHFYLYLMRYGAADGTERVARGVVGAMDVEPFGPRVLAHEETMAHTGADRLGLLATTRANLDLIIALSPSPDLGALLEPEGPPRHIVERDGVRHELYQLDDDRITDTIGGHPLSIADGHHRYTAALELQASRSGHGPWDSIMAFVAPAEGSGLEIRPIHRFFPRLTLPSLDGRFEVERTAPTPPVAPGSITVVVGSGSWLLTPASRAIAHLPAPWRVASTAVAREVLYPTIGVTEGDADFHGDPDRLIERMRTHPGSGVVLMAPVPETAVAEASNDHLRFPRKTTLFTPKPLAGLVFRLFDEQSPA